MHSLVHSFNQEIYIEHLLCARVGPGLRKHRWTNGRKVSGNEAAETKRALKKKNEAGNVSVRQNMSGLKDCDEKFVQRAMEKH